MHDAIHIVDPRSGAEAWVAPSLGFNCYDFRAPINGQIVHVLDSPDDVLDGNARPSGFGIPILFPFPNRIREGTFEWEGKSYSVPISPGKPNAIHGFCLDRPWRVTEQTSQSVSGQFQLSVDDPDRLSCWPADFILDVRYRVEENRLECQFRITNPADVPLPWGLGTHAYFRLPLGAESQPNDCVFTVPVTEEWELSEYLPTGRRLPIETKPLLKDGIRYGSVPFDNAYAGWESDGGTVRCSIIDERAGMELTQVSDGSLFRHAVVYTPPGRNAVCIEPYTCVTDAINLETRDVNTGLQVLPPGQTAQTWIAIQVSPVYS